MESSLNTSRPLAGSTGAKDGQATQARRLRSRSAPRRCLQHRERQLLPPVPYLAATNGAGQIEVTEVPLSGDPALAFSNVGNRVYLASNGVSGSFFENGIFIYRSTTSGATWTRPIVPPLAPPDGHGTVAYWSSADDWFGDPREGVRRGRQHWRSAQRPRVRDLGPLRSHFRPRSTDRHRMPARTARRRTLTSTSGSRPTRRYDPGNKLGDATLASSSTDGIKWKAAPRRVRNFRPHRRGGCPTPTQTVGSSRVRTCAGDDQLLPAGPRTSGSPRRGGDAGGRGAVLILRLSSSSSSRVARPEENRRTAAYQLRRQQSNGGSRCSS